PAAPTATGTPNACSGQGIGYQTVGMQSLVNIVRGTGASNVIALPGLGYSNMLSCSPTQSPVDCGMLNSATPPVRDSSSPWNLIPNYGSNNSPSTAWSQPYYDHINNPSPPPPAQPTNGISFASTTLGLCNFSLSNGQINLGSSSQPVDAGDTLIAVFAGQGY